jgi:hypothetical protein
MKRDPIYRIRKSGQMWRVTRLCDGAFVGYGFSWGGAVDVVCRQLGYGVAYR